MEKPKIKKQSRISPWIFGGFVLISLTLLILLQSSNLWKEFTIETASDTLLLYALSSLNFIAFVIFGFIFLRSIIKLMRERRSLQLGAKIKTRLLIYFAAVSILPIIAMAGFSYLFMNRALERWFTQIPENVVREAREVQSRAMTDRFLRTERFAAILAEAYGERKLTDSDLDKIAVAGQLIRIEVLNADGSIGAISEKQLPPEKKAELDKRINKIVAGARSATVSDDTEFDIAVSHLPDGRRLIVVPENMPGESVISLVDSSLSEFDKLKNEQITVRQIALLTLGVLTFLLIFASTWTAFYIARGLTGPIKALAEGADEIARGNLSHRVEILAEDELALLVATFNQMSAKLEENAAELNERRKYMETVLQALPTGVISFDADGRISTINASAAKMLKLDDGNFVGSELSGILKDENRSVIERLTTRAKRIGHATEQAIMHGEIADGNTLNEIKLPVALTAVSMPDSDGSLLVIEDLSELIAAQRASAWQEVARRMAHEIKNPLTPIQLSAERIARRFRNIEARNQDADRNAQDQGDDAIHMTDGQSLSVINDGTETILREVKSLKAMVDEFSRFARLPEANPEPGDLNEIIEQVTVLYEDRLDDISIRHIPAEDLPNVMIDREQMKRVFINLIDNAIEAFEQDAEEKSITINLRADPARDIIVAEVADNGSGIKAANLQKLFQPYFSTKNRGTGLGLAIVHRIIMEHNGKIAAVSNNPRGAKFIIELPVVN